MSDVALYGHGDRLTFQTSLEADGTITMAYRALPVTATGATIGLADGAGTAVEVAPSLLSQADAFAFRFTPVSDPAGPREVWLGPAGPATGLDFALAPDTGGLATQGPMSGTVQDSALADMLQDLAAASSTDPDIA